MGAVTASSNNFDFFPVAPNQKIQKESYLIRLPKDVILEIFKNLKYSDLTQVILTCKTMRNIALHPSLWQKEMELCRKLAESEFFSSRPRLYKAPLRNEKMATISTEIGPWKTFKSIIVSIDSHCTELTLSQLASEKWNYVSTEIIKCFERYFNQKLIEKWKTILTGNKEFVLDRTVVFQDESFQICLKIMQEVKLQRLVIQCPFNHGLFLKFCEALRQGLPLTHLTLEPSDQPSAASIKALVDALGAKNTRLEQLNWKFSITDSDSRLLREKLQSHPSLRYLEINCGGLTINGLTNLMYLVKSSPYIVDFHLTGLSSIELDQLFSTLNRLQIKVLTLGDPFSITGMINSLADHLIQVKKEVTLPKIKLPAETITALGTLLPRIPSFVMPIGS